MKKHIDIAENRIDLRLLILIYSALFVLMTLGIYYSFISEGKTLIRYYADNKDAFSQRYIFLFEFKRFLNDLFAHGTFNTWDWTIGLGADGLAFNLSGIVNPTNLMTLWNQESHADITYSLGIILKLYFSGFTFILLGRKTGLKDAQAIAGALMYAFSSWNIFSSVTQGTFLVAPVLLPLVILGLEKVMREESPLLFILSVAYTVLCSFTFAYMIALVTIIYYFVRFFTGERKDFLKTTLKTMLYGLTGIAVSGVGFVLIMMRYGRSTSSTGSDFPMLFDITTYLRFPLRLVDHNTLFGSNSMLSVSSMALIFLPVILLRCYRKKTNSVMAVLLMLLTLIPYIHSVFNFFSYISGRWMFALSLFFSLAAAECLEGEKLKDRKIRISILLSFVLYSAYLAWLLKILNDTHRNMVFATWITAALLLILIEVCVPLVRYVKADILYKVICPLMILVMSFGMIRVYDLDLEKKAKRFLTVGEAAEIISTSPQRVLSAIDDKDFYRIDQLGDLTGSWAPHCKVNESMYYDTKGVCAFNSGVDSKWLEYNKLIGNNMGYYKRVAPNSNDNRFGPDLLMGVKYYLGDDKNGIKNASDYAGPGFRDFSEIDGVSVMKNRYSIGMGCVFHKFITRSQWLKLDYPERELAMLEAVVVDDDTQVPDSMTRLLPKDLEGTVKKLDYKLEKNSENISISGKNDGKHQVILSLKNLRNSKDARMFVTVEYGDLVKYGVNTKDDNRGFPDIEDMTFNLGYREDVADDININLRVTGTDPTGVEFQYDSIDLFAVPLYEYDKRAEILEGNSLSTEVFENDYYKGTVDAEKEEILYLPILSDDGWTVKIDGKEVEKYHDIDIAFMGVSVPEGKHTVELTYHTEGLLPGILLSIAGIMITVIIESRRRRVNGKH